LTLQTLRKSQWVPFPVELVFAFFANPANLPHLMPPAQKPKIESSRLIPPPPRPVATDPALRFQSPAAGTGSEMVISFRAMPWMPFRMGWLARITEFEWNDHFCDEQVKGPFASWHHCHKIVSESSSGEAGTLIVDELEYGLPLGPLGEMANALFVKRQMEATFEFRQTKLLEILPVAARQAARRA
jgi:ligand-binding SRPBCC domain-containing protein